MVRKYYTSEEALSSIGLESELEDTPLSGTELLTENIIEEDDFGRIAVKLKLKILTELQQNGYIIIYFDDIYSKFIEHNSNENILIVKPLT